MDIEQYMENAGSSEWTRIMERGGPPPTLGPGWNPELSGVIQYARGLVKTDAEEMTVAAFMAQAGRCHGFDAENTKVLIAYILKAAASRALARLRTARAPRADVVGAADSSPE